MTWWNPGWHIGMMLIWWGFAIGFAAILVVALARARHQRRPDEEAPARILKRRYARGEIDRETYQRTLDDIARGSSGPDVAP